MLILLWPEHVRWSAAAHTALVHAAVHTHQEKKKTIQCLTCSSWQPGLDGQTCAEQDTPFQELSDYTSSTAASSQKIPIQMLLVPWFDEIKGSESELFWKQLLHES